MKNLRRLFVMQVFCFAVLFTGVPAAYAGCMDDASDAIFGFLSGGLSVAACELKELVAAIQNFIKTVSDLANNVRGNAKTVSDAAVGAVNSAADDINNTVSGAQRDLDNAVSEAQTLTAPQIMAPSMNVNRPAAGSTALAAHPGANAPKVAAGGTTQGAAKTGPNPALRTAPILMAADPQRLHAALERGAQELSTLKTSADQDAAGPINNGLQRARNQATSHLPDADNIVKTALLAPINALLATLNDLVNHPTSLLDPIATINDMVNNISKNIVDTMNQINDVITKDSINTLAAIEPDVQKVEVTAKTGTQLLNAMRKAHQEKSQGALNALESQLNALAPTPIGGGVSRSFVSQGGGGFGRALAPAMPAMQMQQATFRFAPVQSRIHATLQKSVVPYQSVASKLKTDWAAINTRHLAAQPRPVTLHTRQTAQNELDKLFRNKSEADAESTRQNLLNQAKLKYGSDPKLMASIEKNLNSYVHAHVAPAAIRSSPGNKQMVNPQPQPPRNGSLQNTQTPEEQR